MYSRVDQRQGRFWSKAEVEFVIEMRRLGKRVEDIAAALNRPVGAVFSKCKRLIKAARLLPKKPEPWTNEEVGVLKDLTLSDAEIANKLERTIAAVRTKRLKVRVRRREPNPWTEAQDKELTKLRGEGFSFSKIAAVMGRTESAISNRVSTLIKVHKLEALPRSECARRGGIAFSESREDRWTPRERQLIVNLWRSGHSAKEISVINGRSAGSINQELKRLRDANVIKFLSPEETRRRVMRARIQYSRKKYAAAFNTVKSLSNKKAAGYVLGVLYGDGFITIDGNRGSIGLKSTNESFCTAFARALEETFGRKTRPLSRVEPLKTIGGYEYKDVQYYETFLHSVHLGKAIRKVFGYTDEWRWCAHPQYIRQIGTQFADGVIQGFFDAEGSFMRSKYGRYYISASSMNERGLKSIHAILKTRGYKCSMGCDKRRQWKLDIGVQADVRRFADEIGSRIDYKSKRMRACLAAGNTEKLRLSWKPELKM